jgi:formylglycine-generating enzyme required for sulfatase activity
MAKDAVRVFISYSHKDEALRDSLATHLSNLQWQGIISSWYDRQLTAGTEWDDKIKTEMEAADIILLLISPDFVASKYCRDVEIPISLQRHEAKQAYVVPVILRPFDWFDAPFAKLQAFPKDAKPVTTWPNQDEAFVSITQGIRTAAQIMRQYRQEQVEQEQTQRSQYRQQVEEALEDGVISLVERDTLDELREELGLPIEVAAAIEAEVLEPFRRYADNLEKYQQTLNRLIAGGHYPFSAAITQDLAKRQQDLGLKPEDVARVAQPILDQAELADQAKKKRIAEAEQLRELERSQARQREESEAKLARYQQEFSRTIQAEYPLSQAVVEGLRAFQQQLGLQDEDVVGVERPLRASAEVQYQETLKRQREVQQQAAANREAPAKTSPTSSPQTKAGIQLQQFDFDVITVDKTGKENRRTRQSAQFFAEDLGQGVLLEMVKISAGTFQMGSPAGQGSDNERPQHAVTVPAFLLGKYPVTQAQWRAVAALPQVGRALNADPSNFKGDNRPVEQVSWNAAMEFCQRLSQVTGHDYRLPSEAEWEYACRAGTTTEFYFGETLTPKLARCKANLGMALITLFAGETAPVGSYMPNTFGLYDMHGNVWEWCLDHWHENYAGAPTDGSAWLSGEKGSKRLLRGGSWFSNPSFCRSAYRYYFNSGFADDNIGFRVVCVAPRTL